MDPRLHLTSSILAERIVRLIEPHCECIGTCFIQPIRGSHKLESHRIKSVTRMWKYVYSQSHDTPRYGGGLVILHNERLNGSPFLLLSADVDVITCPQSTSLVYFTYSVLPDR